MAAYLASKYRVAVDVAIHALRTRTGTTQKPPCTSSLYHAGADPGGFGSKTRILDDKVTGPQQIEIIREVWETLANDALSRAGHSDVNIDRRTLEAQGIERIPQIHEERRQPMTTCMTAAMTRETKKTTPTQRTVTTARPTVRNPAQATQVAVHRICP